MLSRRGPSGSLHLNRQEVAAAERVARRARARGVERTVVGVVGAARDADAPRRREGGRLPREVRPATRKSNMSTPQPMAYKRSGGVPTPSMRWGKRGVALRQKLDGEARDVLLAARASRPRPGRRARSRRTGARVRNAADRRRSSGTMPLLHDREQRLRGRLLRAARLRSAQWCVRSMASRRTAPSSSDVAFMHTSSTTAMSDPIAACISIDASGVRSCGRPST